MAAGSHQGWFGLPPERRYCAWCEQKLTQKMSIFISGMRQLAWCADCPKRERTEPA